MFNQVLILSISFTILYVVLTFTRLKFATVFTDFTVFTSSIILAILLSFIPIENVFTLSLSLFLYINSIWLYGVESREVSKRKYVFNPATTRVFIGLIVFIISSWLSISVIDARIALITILLSLILGAYKLKSLAKTT